MNTCFLTLRLVLIWEYDGIPKTTIHNKDASHVIVERFFDPIIYQPVTKNMIDSLTIQLIGGHQQVLTIKDSKTIVTLHFRKVTL